MRAASGARRLRFDAPATRHYRLRAKDGRYLARRESGVLGLSDAADDASAWEQLPNGAFRALAGGAPLPQAEGLTGAAPAEVVSVRLDEASPTARFDVEPGGREAPSESLAHFREHGWVCLPALIDEQRLERVRAIAGTGRFEGQTTDATTPALLQTAAVASIAAEPLSLWLTRQYLGTDEVRMAHHPSLAVLAPDDGVREVQGWHSDFPYLWGSPKQIGGDQVPFGGAPGICLGVQRNVCIDPFTDSNGATRYVLGSHAKNHPADEYLGRDATVNQPGYRAEHGLPIQGEGTDVIEAPAGSIVLYDARTWHRAGVNRTGNRRAAILQAMTPNFIMPFTDTSRVYADFLASDLPAQLNPREQRELQHLLVHCITGPGGRQPITTA